MATLGCSVHVALRAGCYRWWVSADQLFSIECFYYFSSSESISQSNPGKAPVVGYFDCGGVADGSSWNQVSFASVRSHSVLTVCGSETTVV